MTTAHRLDPAAGAVTVVLADPHPLVRHGLRAMFAGQDGLEILAEAGTARDAIIQIAIHHPDVLVADLGTVELALVCREAQRFHTAVLAFTNAADDNFLQSAVQAGIRGHLLKSAGPADLLRAVRGVAGGQAIFGPHVAGRITELLSSRRNAVFPDLTPHERELLQLIAAGQPNSIIASRLNVAPKTVRNHTAVLFAKLGVTSRAEAALRARDAGLGR